MNIVTKPIQGKTPAIVLINPKYPNNLGMIVRLASCFGIGQIWFTGKRMTDEISNLSRLPREERLKGYQDVQLIHNDYPFNFFNKPSIVGIEVKEGSQILPYFNHPKNAIYVFGPEDDSIPKGYSACCHQFVTIPVKHCLNLATAVSVVLYDRLSKTNIGFYITPGEWETRG